MAFSFPSLIHNLIVCGVLPTCLLAAVVVSILSIEKSQVRGSLRLLVALRHALK